MTGTAQLWYYRLEMIAGEPSLEHFVQLVLHRFGPTLTETPLSELELLHRTGSMDEYKGTFLTLTCRDIELT